MFSFRIFTESKADIKFLKDYIYAVFNIQLSDDDFDPLGSWSGYKTSGVLKASIKQNNDDSKRNILILDADTDFTLRNQEVMNDFAAFNVPISLFLFPNNNSSGSLETLLCEIAVEKKILTCFEGYETCVTGYEAPVIKSKVFADLDALLPANQKKNDANDLIQDKNRNYRNVNHWNLHHDYLAQLRKFLQPIII